MCQLSDRSLGLLDSFQQVQVFPVLRSSALLTRWLHYAEQVLLEENKKMNTTWPSLGMALM